MSYDAKYERIKVFENTLSIIERTPKVKNSQEKSIEKTLVYHEGGKFEKHEKIFPKTNIIVTRNRTMEAGRKWAKLGNTAVLNFASATNPGGGVTKGSIAQEECLCRVSTLYNCLNTPLNWNLFYNPNREMKDPLHDDKVIYTPKVCVIKDDDYKTLDEKEFFFVDVITCAAPNLREKPLNYCNTGESDVAISITPEKLYNIHAQRARRILDIAAVHGIKNLVLGAFGCGAFKNDPNVVARAYADVLKDYDGVFENIEFAVYCGSDTSNYDIFKETLCKQ